LLAGIGFKIVAHVAEDAQAGGRTDGLACSCAELARRGHGLYSRPTLLKTMAIRAGRESGRFAKRRRE
jgi:hypothetical protein